MRAECPLCTREVAGAVNRKTGHLILRKRRRPDAYGWCNDQQPVDAGHPERNPEGTP